MFKRLLIGTLSVCMASVAFSQGMGGEQMETANAEFKFTGTYYWPKENDDWDNAYDVQLRAHYWVQDWLGFGIAVGAGQWDVKENTMQMTEGSLNFKGTQEGNIQTIPFGASLLLRPVNTDSFELTVEGGLRKFWIDSDVKVTFEEADEYSGDPETDVYKLDIQDGFVAVAAMDADYKITESLSLFAGVGYQWDMNKGKIEYQGTEIDKNKLEAFFAHAGIAIGL